MKKAVYALLIFSILLALFYLALSLKEPNNTEAPYIQSIGEESLVIEKNFDSAPIKSAIDIAKEVKDKEVIDSPNLNNDNKNNKEELVQVSGRDLIVALGNERSLRVYDEYNKGIYEPSYDQTWQMDMQSAIYAQLDVSSLSGKAFVQDYKCEDSNYCEVKISIFPETTDRMHKINDYLLSLKEQPEIMHSGKKRNVYLQSIEMGESGFEVDIVIGSDRLQD